MPTNVPIDSRNMAGEIDKKTPLEELRRRYQKCKSKEEKFSFCVLLLDNGIVSVAKPLDMVLTIFGSDCTDLGVDEDGYGRIQIRFAEWVENPMPDSPDWLDGWYLAVYYSRERKVITKYFLSDIWKSPMMNGWGMKL